MRLVLASTSKYRRELMDRLGVPYTAVPAAIDEEAEKKKAGPLGPDALALHLARKKAQSIRDEDALVIGSDQVVALGDRIFSKPHTEDAAVRQLLELAGKEHRIVTAVAVFSPGTGRTEEAVSAHVMEMRPLSEAAARAYVRRDRPLDCAGSYRVEAAGVALFRKMTGDDFTSIVGLPLTSVVTLLEKHGHRIFPEA